MNTIITCIQEHYYHLRDPLLFVLVLSKKLTISFQSHPSVEDTGSSEMNVTLQTININTMLYRWYLLWRKKLWNLVNLIY